MEDVNFIVDELCLVGQGRFEEFLCFLSIYLFLMTKDLKGI